MTLREREENGKEGKRSVSSRRREERRKMYEPVRSDDIGGNDVGGDCEFDGKSGRMSFTLEI